MKPEGITDEAWQAAKEAIEPWLGPSSQYRHDCQEGVARAILAAEAREREACAQVAETRLGQDGRDPWAKGYRCSASDIATLIRTRTNTPTIEGERD
jgi:hypothetical protein